MNGLLEEINIFERRAFLLPSDNSRLEAVAVLGIVPLKPGNYCHREPSVYPEKAVLPFVSAWDFFH